MIVLSFLIHENIKVIENISDTLISNLQTLFQLNTQFSWDIENIEKNIAETTAKLLLQIKAIKLNPENPFIWASGWNSPIYCDNWVTLSYVSIRNMYNSF